MTSEHYPENRVERTPPMPGLPTAKELMDIGSLLQERGGYEVVWKGKWHLSLPVEGGNDWSAMDIANLQDRFDLKGWNPPDAGNAIQQIQPMPDATTFPGLTTLGGGYANNDSRYVRGMSKDAPQQTAGYGSSVLDYLSKVATTPQAERKPFCLFISLVNPHDVWVYPNAWEAAGYKKDDFASMGIALPDNYADDLTTKPSVQLLARDAYNAKAPLKNLEAEQDYVNFYAYLHTAVDRQIETVLEALDATGLTDSTIIIRTADHGELGLSHGMREKAYSAYEEMIHIPLIISNPKMYPFPQTTDSFYCHLDLLPTLADLGGIPDPSSYGKGVSVVPVLRDPSASVRDSVLFTYDDVFFLPFDVPGGHIRALRDGNWTYAVYYSEEGTHFEYELYDLRDDPGQLTIFSMGPSIRKRRLRPFSSTTK
jgi:arylsulfatase A-like enzyme